MSATIYNKAFVVELAHNFYYDSLVPDNIFKLNTNIEVVPTIECADVLKNARMRFVRSAKGLMIFYQAYTDASNAQLPVIKIDDGAEFIFAFRMLPDSMPLLMNVSNLDTIPKNYTAEKFLMLEKTVGNTANPESVTLDYSLANMLRPELFTYTFKPSTAYTGLADVVINLGLPSEFTIGDVPYDAVTKTYTVEIDLRKYPKGFYTLTAFEAGGQVNQLHATDFYMDGALVKENALGIIRIKYSEADRLYDATSTLPNKFKTFKHTVLARSTYWRYYVIPQNIDTTIYDIAVIDGTSTYQFTASFPGGNPEYGKPDTSITINGLNPVILKSTAQIPYNEKVLKGLAVYKKTGGTPSPVIDNISNALNTGVDSDRLGAVQQPTPSITPGISEIFVIV